ncbi:MAG: hypothetical protein D6759_13420 [Chloroflexi bacterium]|nr:MAG: hypothetical protein D6759_13420 [Chloroflexota bacterium]
MDHPILSPLSILIAGAGVALLLGVIPRFRWPSRLASWTTLLTTVAAWLSWIQRGRSLPTPPLLILWRPGELFRVALLWRLTTLPWLMGTVLLGISVAWTLFTVTAPPIGWSSLRALRRRVSRLRRMSSRWLRRQDKAEEPEPDSEEPPPPEVGPPEVESPGTLPPARAAELLLLTAALAALMAGNFVTLAVTWGLVDLMLATTLALHGPAGGRRAGLTLAVNGPSILLLLMVALLAQDLPGGGDLTRTVLEPPASVWLMGAAVLRLGLYPLHLWVPLDLESEPAKALPVYLIPPLVALALWTRLPALLGNVLPPRVGPIAGATLLVGAITAWGEADRRRSVPLLAMAGLGLVALTATAAPQSVAEPIVVLGTLLWMLTVSLLALGWGFQRRRPGWSLPYTVALLSALGLPGTLGFPLRATLYQYVVLLSPGGPLLALVTLLGEAVWMATLLRFWWSLPLPEARPGGQRLLQAVGSAIPALLLLFLGLRLTWPLVEPILQASDRATWLGWGLPLLTGGLLAWWGHRAWSYVTNVWTSVTEVLCLDWLYGLLYSLAWQVARLLRGTLGTFEGEGALLWVSLTLLLLVLFLQGGL